MPSHLASGEDSSALLPFYREAQFALRAACDDTQYLRSRVSCHRPINLNLRGAWLCETLQLHLHNNRVKYRSFREHTIRDEMEPAWRGCRLLIEAGRARRVSRFEEPGIIGAGFVTRNQKQINFHCPDSLPQICFIAAGSSSIFE